MDNASNPASLLLEENEVAFKSIGLFIDRALQPSDDGTACLRIQNVGGFTEQVGKGKCRGDLCSNHKTIVLYLQMES